MKLLGGATVAKAKKQGHGGYMQSIKGHIEVRGKTKPFLELWIQITPENAEKLLSQIKKSKRL
jgi:hypothetical protein